MTKRIYRAELLIIAKLSYKWRFLKLFYWADRELFEQGRIYGRIYVMPEWYYICIFKSCMRLLHFKCAHHIADVGIHSIPYHIRFKAS